MSGGRIQAVGTHQALLEDSPLYREMWNSHISVKDRKEAPVHA